MLVRDNNSCWQEHRLADRLRRQPVCAFCEEPVQGDFYYHIEHRDVCWDCLKLHFRRETLT